MKLAVLVPAPQNVPLSFVSSVMELMMYTQFKAGEIGIDHLFISFATGVRTDKNRNFLLSKLEEQQPDYDYVLWLDADMTYPHDMVETYFKSHNNPDIMGCLYFKRSYPHEPIAYMENPDEESEMPWMYLDGKGIFESGEPLMKVHGLGFGGLMVSKRVYEALGEDRWVNYDTGFHLPYKNPHGSTHDLVFCKKAREAGFEILLNTEVRPGHIAEKIVTVEDWEHEVQ